MLKINGLYIIMEYIMREPGVLYTCMDLYTLLYIHLIYFTCTASTFSVAGYLGHKTRDHWFKCLL